MFIDRVVIPVELKRIVSLNVSESGYQRREEAMEEAEMYPPVEIERGNTLMERRPGCPSMGARAISWTVSRDGTIRACIRVLTSLS